MQGPHAGSLSPSCPTLPSVFPEFMAQAVQEKDTSLPFLGFPFETGCSSKIPFFFPRYFKERRLLLFFVCLFFFSFKKNKKEVLPLPENTKKGEEPVLLTLGGASKELKRSQIITVSYLVPASGHF